MAGNQGLHSAENGKLGGRPKLFATKLREAIIRKAEEHAEELAEAILSKALGKKDSLVDVPAMKELFDRGLGKALQNVDMTTNGESLNERVTKLEDGQLEQLIASVGSGSVHSGRLEAPNASTEGGAGSAVTGEAA